MKSSAWSLDLEKLVAETIRLNEIPAPTFDESAKAAYVQNCFTESGLANVRLDRVGNVLGELGEPGSDGDLVLAAHIDTVFPHGTDVGVRRHNGKLTGAGIGDNNLAVAALLEIARQCAQNEIPKRRIVFVATVGEEGLGDLRGIRALIEDYAASGAQPGAVIAIEGHGLGNICHQGVGSRRMEVIVRGPGGHSWGRAGQPSAIHVLANLMHRLTRVNIPAMPRTSFNIGTVDGGISVNTIAPDARMVFEVRSVDETTLANVWTEMQRSLDGYRPEDGITIEKKLVGNRPAGGIGADTPLVRLCREVYNSLGVQVSYPPMSTDANIPLSLGIPAVCIGISRGANAHRTDEWIEIAPAQTGVRALLKIVERLAYSNL
jgi:tripeptide aminopeptidase